MFPAPISSSTSFSDEAAGGLSSCSRGVRDTCTNDEIHMLPTISNHHQQKKARKKRSLPGNPDPDAEVIALSPKTLMATNRFVCEVCNKGFQRDQNLQLHRRGHNLPWKLKQRGHGGGSTAATVRKRAYVCPEPTCVHHHPSRALGDLTGIKKHYCRKHGEKKWKCDKCGKVYAVQSDWKAHTKTCGTREYRCDCGTIFSRKDSFVTHRAFCDALAEESARLSAASQFPPPPPLPHLPPPAPPAAWEPPQPSHHHHQQLVKPETATFGHFHLPPPLLPLPYPSAAHLSATALLQKATAVGVAGSEMMSKELIMSSVGDLGLWKKGTGHRDDGFTRDFLGLTGGENVTIDKNNTHNNNMAALATKGSMEFQQGYDQGHEQPLTAKGNGFGYPAGTWSCC